LGALSVRVHVFLCTPVLQYCCKFTDTHAPLTTHVRTPQIVFTTSTVMFNELREAMDVIHESGKSRGDIQVRHSVFVCACIYVEQY